MNFEFYKHTHLFLHRYAVSPRGVTAQCGKTVLVATCGGGVKGNVTFDCAMMSRKDAGVTVTECSGVEPNPRIASV